MTMQVIRVENNKKQYLPLLLLADEQESMVDRYLEQGEMFALLDDGNVVGECVVTEEAPGICELKNIAITPSCQRKGYGRYLVDYVCAYYRSRFVTMLVGTGESLQTLLFYRRCGFRYSHRVPDFFTDNYDHPIIEDGRLLRDMIYLQKRL